MVFEIKNTDFPHEDRQFGGNTLFVDLIPETTHGKGSPGSPKFI